MSTSLSYGEKELLEKVAAGNQAAFAELYRAWRQRVYYSALDVLQSPAAASDALQEVFIKLWVNREQLGGMEHFGSWFKVLIRNYLYDQFRAQALRERALEHLVREAAEETADPTHTEIEYRELTQLVLEAMELLPAQQKRVFTLSRSAQMKHREIASELGISPETVKKHIMEAMRHIRAYLHANGKVVPAVLLIRLLFS